MSGDIILLSKREGGTVPHPPPIPEVVSSSNIECCLNHHNNDSGSYDGASEFSKNSSGSEKDTAINSSGSKKDTAISSSKKDTTISNSSGPASSSVTILISNGNEDSSTQLSMSGGSSTELPQQVSGGSPRAPSSSTLPPRTASSASIYSEGRGSVGQSSSSSSFDLSQASSRELLEQLMSTPSEGDHVMENNEIVKQLLEHIVALKLELEEMKLENMKLKGMRSTMDDELSTLTENLFEEAYKMVDTAKEEKGAAVKRLADASGKIDAMETEMSALKNLLHTPSSSLTANGITPSSHHHNSKHRKSVKKAFKKLTRKVKSSSSKSASNYSEVILPLTLLEHKNEIKGAALNEGEMLPCDFSEFNDWLSVISNEEDHPYLSKVEDVDVMPCLSFKDKKLSSLVLSAARDNDLLMESLGPCCSEGEEDKRVCALSGCDEVCCTHRLKLGSSDQWLYISGQCRDRIAAACDFYMYIGHIEKGILKLEASQLYWQVSRLRAMMTMARLTLHLPD